MGGTTPSTEWRGQWLEDEPDWDARIDRELALTALLRSVDGERLQPDQGMAEHHRRLPMSTVRLEAPERMGLHRGCGYANRREGYVRGSQWRVGKRMTRRWYERDLAEHRHVRSRLAFALTLDARRKGRERAKAKLRRPRESRRADEMRSGWVRL